MTNTASGYRVFNTSKVCWVTLIMSFITKNWTSFFVQKNGNNRYLPLSAYMARSGVTLLFLPICQAHCVQGVLESVTRSRNVFWKLWSLTPGGISPTWNMVSFRVSTLVMTNEIVRCLKALAWVRRCLRGICHKNTTTFESVSV